MKLHRSLKHLRFKDSLDLALISMSHSFSDGYTSLIAPVLSLIVLDFGLSESQVGLLLSASTFATFLLVLPVSLIADLSGKRVEILLSGLAIATFSYLLMLRIETFWPILMLVFLARGGNSVFHPCGTSVVAKRFIGKTSVAISVYALAGNIGTTFIPSAQGFIAEGLGWRISIAVFTIPLIILSPLIWIRFRDLFAGEESKKIQGSYIKKSITIAKSVFQNKYVKIIGIVFALGGIASKTSVGFIPILASKRFSMSPSEIGLLISLYFGMGIISKPLLVFLYRSFGLRTALRIPITVSAFATFSIVFAPGKIILFLLVGIVGLSNPISPIILAVTADHAQPEVLTTSLGFAYTMHSISFIGPLIGGFFAEKYSLSVTYIFSVCVFIFAWLSTCFLKANEQRDYKPEA